MAENKCKIHVLFILTKLSNTRRGTSRTDIEGNVLAGLLGRDYGFTGKPKTSNALSFSQFLSTVLTPETLNV